MSTKIASRRERLDAWVHSARVQNVIMAVILVNSITIGAETVVDHGSRAYTVLFVLDHIALAVFIVEIAVKLVAIGPVRFFSRGWNVFDFIVVAIALVPGAGPLSVLRTLRVMRLLRVIKFMPSLRRVVESLLLSLPGISAIALLMAMIFYVSAVMSTAMFGEQFPEWFGTLGRSLYTLFQIMTLEGWSDGIVRPVMEQSPWSWVFFIPFILVSAFTMLNLFVAVIVDTMSNLAPVGPQSAGSTAHLSAEPAADPDADPTSAPTSDPAPGPRTETTSSGAVEAELLAEVRTLREEIAALRASLTAAP